MIKNYFGILKLLLFFIVLILLPFKSLGQCAGDDANIEVCNIPDPGSQSIDLFDLLGSNATSGGTWTDDDLSRGLNVNTGILNAQAIPSSGIYRYTYTVLGNMGCTDTSATVTVVIGGYAGDAEKALACSDDNSFNLFHVFDGSYLSPQSNGTWHNDTLGIDVGSTIDAEALGPGNFYFTYTISAIGSCVETSSTGLVSIFIAPKSGIPSKLLLCDDADFSLYTNYDLHNLLADEDDGGTWTDNNGTGQITFIKDHNVDVEYIYNNFGIGEYYFSYTVLPPSPICERKTSTVSIRIEKLLDFTGATLVVNSDICEAQIPTATYSATINQGIQNIPNGQYYVTYSVSGPNGGTATILSSFNNGILNFPLNKNHFQEDGDFRVEILDIRDFNSEGACNNIIDDLFDILYIYPTPDLSGAKLIIDPVCQNKNALVRITDASLLADGNYDIVYDLKGANITLPQTVQIVSVGGVSSFIIPGDFIVNEGNTVVSITKITNVITNCTNLANINKTMIVNPLPSSANLNIAVEDYCLNKPVPVNISGLGTLVNVKITYTLSGANTATQTIILAPSDGKASFIMPPGLLTETGVSIIAITELVNEDTTCSTLISNIFDSFSINPIPDAPATASQQEFCKTDAHTVADLEPNGSQYQWFDSTTSTTPLANSVTLVSGNYYVKEIAPVTLCLSEATMIKVIINDLPEPVLNQNGDVFCGIDEPKISDLSGNTNVPASIVWYDALNNGNVLNSTTLLQDNVTYYGFDFSSVTGCFSENYIGVTVSLTDCSISQYAFFIPDGFSPNGDGVNDTFTIPDINFLYPDYTLEIFNRYGNIMFKGNRNKPDWDGRSSESSGFGGGIAPNGVYFYIVNFNKDNRRPQQGRLYLNR